MSKTYLQKDVLTAARERTAFIFDEFEHVYFSFSGGKDSGVMLELALEEARKRDRLPLNVLLIDLEGHYNEHIEYSLRVCDRPEVRPHWICLPLSLRNAVSQYDPKWICWEEEKQNIWVRPMPERDYVIRQDNMPEAWLEWFRKGMEFEEFIINFADWFAEINGAEKIACVVGIRADESMNRYRTIVSERKTRYKDMGWSTQVQGCKQLVYNFYPVYDWGVTDVWKYVGEYALDYNRIYDFMYKKGRSVHDMRICQPYGDDQRQGLDLFHECDPEAWERVVQRVAGANFGAIYKGGSILGNIKVELPADHSWESYAKLLLMTMPPYLRDHYVRRINVFLKWWARELGREIVSIQKPSEGEDYDELGLFIHGIPDKPDASLGETYTRNGGPSWKRICKAIIKNDYYCKSLSFNQNRQEWDKLEALKQKYADL